LGDSPPSPKARPRGSPSAGSPPWQRLAYDELLAGQLALALVRQHLDPGPVVAVIFTHSHIDHFAGVRAVLPEDPAARAEVRILAPRGFVEEATSENILAGIAMLVLPGQGLLSILIGVTLLNFPGKYALERRIVGRPAVSRTLNRIRARARRPPLEIPDSESR